MTPQVAVRHTARVMKLILLISAFAAFALVSCETVPRPPSESRFTAADYGPVPSNWRQLATDYLKQQLRDPYSAHIMVPDQTPVRSSCIVGNKWVPAYSVRGLVNAKNAFGAYTGIHVMVVWLSHGQVLHSLDMTEAIQQ